MKPRPRQPRLFIGSSTEGLPIAYGIQENLEFDAETTVWKQGIFHPTRQTLADLVAAMQSTDFAVFVFNADDVLMMRGKKFEATRDNSAHESQDEFWEERSFPPMKLLADRWSVAP